MKTEPGGLRPHDTDQNQMRTTYQPPQTEGGQEGVGLESAHAMTCNSPGIGRDRVMPSIATKGGAALRRCQVGAEYGVPHGA